VRIKTHGFAVNGNDFAKIKPIGQISVMEEIGHRYSPECWFGPVLTQHSRHRDAKDAPFGGFFDMHNLPKPNGDQIYPKTTIPQHIINVLGYGAQEKTRTSTTLRSLAPEASASTNSATWA
tara:strand:- start:20516 stop:20878 length:363 start_codon:yes stop_codon:yes gene_type:complete